MSISKDNIIVFGLIVAGAFGLWYATSPSEPPAPKPAVVVHQQAAPAPAPVTPVAKPGIIERITKHTKKPDACSEKPKKHKKAEAPIATPVPVAPQVVVEEPPVRARPMVDAAHQVHLD